jgi:uncharacterized Tic20 family protein
MSIAMPLVDEHVDVRPAAASSPREGGADGTTSASQESAHEFACHITPAGRLRIHRLPQIDRNFAIALHLAPFGMFIAPAAFLALLAPLVLWLIRKDRSTFVDDHGKEMLNFMISYVVTCAVLLLSCLLIIGIPVAVIGIPTLTICGIINMIRGAIAAGHDEYFRYPMTFRILT